MIAFKPDVEKIKMARDHVAKIAVDWSVNDYFVRVVTSELVTNASAPRGALPYPRLSREELKGGSWV